MELMPIKPNFDSHHFYFVTTAAIGHAHLFRRDVVKRIIVDSLHHIRTTRGVRLFIFVIMPNHIHIIARFSDEYPMPAMMRDFKKFTARQIYHQFGAEGNFRVLDMLHKEGKKVRQEYKVWEDDYDARDVFSIEFLQQKMDYIHHNPCQPQWKLAESPEKYLWSTAGYYLDGIPCIIPIDDVREFLV
jgi:REP element-mobilizing transposase RayT